MKTRFLRSIWSPGSGEYILRARPVALEHRVNKRCERRALRHHDERSQQEQGHDNGQQPPAFLLAEKSEQLAGGLRVSNCSTKPLHDFSLKESVIIAKTKLAIKVW